MFDAVFTQTQSQQSSLWELIKNCSLEELQGLLSRAAGTRPPYRSGVTCPRSAPPAFHSKIQTGSNQVLTFILKIALERGRGLFFMSHTRPPRDTPALTRGDWVTSGNTDRLVFGRSVPGNASAASDQLRRSASDQLPTPLNKEPLLLRTHCPTHLFLSNTQQQHPGKVHPKDQSRAHGGQGQVWKLQPCEH